MKIVGIRFKDDKNRLGNIEITVDEVLPSGNRIVELAVVGKVKGRRFAIELEKLKESAQMVAHQLMLDVETSHTCEYCFKPM